MLMVLKAKELGVEAGDTLMLEERGYLLKYDIMLHPI